jgi:sugar O-acyltransferase (sialic acid O-acetyltransferase NeuD family)
MKSLAILGASGHGKVVADAAVLCGWNDIAFFDDNWPYQSMNGSWPVLGDCSQLLDQCGEFDNVIVAIGDNVIRSEKSIALIEAGASLATIIHPSSIISPFASIKPGSFVSAGAVIQVGVDIGRFSLINTRAVVEHDCLLGEGVHLSPGALLAGAVSIGDRSWVGIGACVRQRVDISSDVIVGAGAVVVKSIHNSCIVVGSPARRLVR